MFLSMVINYGSKISSLVRLLKGICKMPISIIADILTSAEIDFTFFHFNNAYVLMSFFHRVGLFLSL